MFLTFLYLVVGLGLIVFGAEWLVNGSSSIARRFGLSEFLVGMTIVGIGTSTPEMVVSFISSINGNSDIAVGNIVGSNIANTFLILGFVAVISPIALTKSNIKWDIPLSFIASVILFILAWDTLVLGKESNTLTRIDGAILFIGFVFFITYSIRHMKDLNNNEDIPINEEVKSAKQKPIWRSIIAIIVGLGALIFGGRLFVNSGSSIASHYGVSDAFIGITIMAVGTSLPELAASVVAALKKKSQMALGNIVGSNIFNIFLILGGSSMIRPLTMTNITIVDMSVLLLTSITIFLSAYCFKKKAIDRWEGVIFLLLYIGYIVYLALNL